MADDSSIGVYNLDGDLKSKTAVPEANPADHSTEKFSLIDIPPQYRRQKGPRGKQRIKRFEYDRYNVLLLYFDTL